MYAVTLVLLVTLWYKSRIKLLSVGTLTGYTEICSGMKDKKPCLNSLGDEKRIRPMLTFPGFWIST